TPRSHSCPGSPSEPGHTTVTRAPASTRAAAWSRRKGLWGSSSERGNPVAHSSTRSGSDTASETTGGRATAGLRTRGAGRRALVRTSGGLGPELGRLGEVHHHRATAHALGHPAHPVVVAGAVRVTVQHVPVHH